MATAFARLGGYRSLESGEDSRASAKLVLGTINGPIRSILPHDQYSYYSDGGKLDYDT